MMEPSTSDSASSPRACPQVVGGGGRWPQAMFVELVLECSSPEAYCLLKGLPLELPETPGFSLVPPLLKTFHDLFR